MIPTCLKYEALGAFLFATSAQLCSASAQESASANPSKPRPGQLSYATSGPGVPHHLFVELLSSMTDLKMTMVPYKGSLQALNDLAAGHVPLMMVDIGPALGAIQGVSVRALGVSTSQRFPTISDVPRIGDTVPGFDAAGWFMVAAPAGLPPLIAAKLHAGLDTFLGDN